MTSLSHPPVPVPYIARVHRLLQDGQRKLLGLVGPPGAGKSTLATALQQTFMEVSRVVPMDGFHLANAELRRLGRTDRKGAPDTFDSAGYVALLHRLRRQRPDETIYVPEFRREIEEPIAGAIAVLPDMPLVITEGNYLLLEDSHWVDVAPMLDEVWYVDLDRALRMERLARRHEAYGRSPQEAIDWTANTDEPNAWLIEQTKARATLVFQWEGEAAPLY